MKVISVKFKENGRSYYFDPCDFEIKEGDYVIVTTARGTECGFYQSHNEGPFDFSYSAICTNTLFILYTLLYRQIPCLSIL